MCRPRSRKLIGEFGERHMECAYYFLTSVGGFYLDFLHQMPAFGRSTGAFHISGWESFYALFSVA